MTLFKARVDLDRIIPVLQWKSDMIIHYLHKTPKGFTDSLYTQMFQYGNCALIPLTNACF